MVEALIITHKGLGSIPSTIERERGFYEGLAVCIFGYFHIHVFVNISVFSKVSKSKNNNSKSDHYSLLFSYRERQAQP